MIEKFTAIILEKYQPLYLSTRALAMADKVNQTGGGRGGGICHGSWDQSDTECIRQSPFISLQRESDRVLATAHVVNQIEVGAHTFDQRGS